MSSTTFTLPDIYTYQELPYWKTVEGTRLWYGLLVFGIIIGLIGAYAVYRWLVYRRPQTVIEWRDEQVVLLNEMVQSPKTSYEDFFVHITNFLKTYLHTVVGLSVSTVTDTELIDIVTKWTRSKKVRMAVEDIVVTAQSIKFAREHGFKTQAERALKSLRVILTYAPISDEKNRSQRV